MTETEKAYYQKRAPEYDDWYLGIGRFAAWSVVDVACGTGFLTQHLTGHVVALDRSVAMLQVAACRLHGSCRPTRYVEGLLAGHFYGHLVQPNRARFLTEARRVAGRMLVIDAALRDEVQPEKMQERVLSDGSRHTVYKRYFTPEQLPAELGRGQVLQAGRWFVAVLAVC